MNQLEPDGSASASTTLLANGEGVVSQTPLQYRSLPWLDKELESKAARNHIIWLYADKILDIDGYPIIKILLTIILIVILFVLFLSAIGYVTGTGFDPLKLAWLLFVFVYGCWYLPKVLKAFWYDSELAKFERVYLVVFVSFSAMVLLGAGCLWGMSILRPYLSGPATDVHDKIYSVLEPVLIVLSVVDLIAFFLCVFYMASTVLCPRPRALEADIDPPEIFMPAKNEWPMHSYYCYDLTDKCVKVVCVHKDTKEIVCAPPEGNFGPLDEIDTVVIAENPETGFDACYVKKKDESLVEIDNDFVNGFGGCTCESCGKFVRMLQERITATKACTQLDVV